MFSTSQHWKWIRPKLFLSASTQVTTQFESQFRLIASMFGVTTSRGSRPSCHPKECGNCGDFVRCNYTCQLWSRYTVTYSERTSKLMGHHLFKSDTICSYIAHAGGISALIEAFDPQRFVTDFELALFSIVRPTSMNCLGSNWFCPTDRKFLTFWQAVFLGTTFLGDYPPAKCALQISNFERQRHHNV